MALTLIPVDGGDDACSWTRSALREFVTITVTVDAPSDVFGLSFVGAAAVSR
jgi:hypothetical protein